MLTGNYRIQPNRRTKGSGEEFPNDRYESTSQKVATGAAESEFYFDGNRWQPRTYAAAMELLAISLGNIRGAFDLAEHIVLGDGRLGPKVDLGALPGALRAANDEIDAAYAYADFAAKAAGDDKQALAALAGFWPVAREQLARIPAMMQRANNRALNEGMSAGYYKGFADGLAASGGKLNRIMDSVDHAVDTGGRVADHAVHEAGKQAPWLAVALAGAAVVLGLALKR